MAHTVTVSLDDESKKLFDEIPRGYRSQFIRNAITDAAVISDQASLLEAFRRKIDYMKKEAYRKDGWEWDDFTWVKPDQVANDAASARRG